MNYWWVNQNKTYRQEVGGGFLWSPKLRANNTRNPFYEFMREVSPGDLVFSFAKTRIPAFGVAQSFAYEAPKPAEFGAAGRDWSTIGWRVDVRFVERHPGPRPAEYIDLLRPLLPKRYSPLQESNGHGVQSIYLTRLPEELALQLAMLVGSECLAQAQQVAAFEFPHGGVEPGVVEWEEHLLEEVEADTSLTSTDRQALITARRGQGTFRSRVERFERGCRITGVDRKEHLRASHCKPWRDCSQDERLDGANGLLLTPSIDHLFDRGFISFADDGELLLSPVAHRPSLARMGVPVEGRHSVGAFRPAQEEYLEFHRDAVFLRARVG